MEKQPQSRMHAMVSGKRAFRRDMFTDEDFVASAITDVLLETLSQPSDSVINQPVPAV